METVEIQCRCKDCKYSYKHKHCKTDKAMRLYCHFWCSTEEPEEVQPDWFCSNGEHV